MLAIASGLLLLLLPSANLLASRHGGIDGATHHHDIFR